MEERKLKRKSSRTSSSPAPPTAGAGPKPSAPSAGPAGHSHTAATQASQKSKSRRGVRDKPRRHLGSRANQNQNQGQAAPVVQHSFLTDVSDVQEMENGLLSLLNDFHSGKLQAFGNECSIGQMEHVREMQEKLARLHFDLYGEVDEMPEDQRKTANMDTLLLNLEELSTSIQKLNLADSQETQRTASM